MSDEPDYIIVPSPQLRVVSVGAVVNYELKKNKPGVPDPSQLVGFTWYAVNDPASVNWLKLRFERVDKPVIGPPEPKWANIKWGFDGHHKIVCELARDGKTTHYEYEQWVASLLQATEQGPALLFTKDDPPGVLDALNRKLSIIEQIANAHPPTPGPVLERHKKQTDDLTKLRDRLTTRLAPSQGKQRIILAAEHLDQVSQRRSRLRVFAIKTGETSWKVVDWTDPTTEGLTGEFDGSGASSVDAFKNAVKEWAGRNRYPAGAIRIKIQPQAELGAYTEDEFETTGGTTWDHVVNVLDDIAMVGAVVAGVVTLVAPVPGSQLVSAAIWVSILSSSAAAVINIGQRYEDGFSSVGADAFDVLTIVGNAFVGGAGAVLWKRGAQVTLQTTRGIITGVLVAQIGVDAVQGIIVGVEDLQQIESINSDPDVTPSEKLDKICQILSDLAVRALLLFVNIKGTRADVENLKKQQKYIPGPTPEERLKQLADPKQKIDLRDPPKVEGHTKDGTHKTTVQVDQESGPIQVKGTETEAVHAPPSQPTRQKIRPVNGRINAGGGFEDGSELASNLNPTRPGTGGPARGIPNHVLGTFQNIDEYFYPGSAEVIFSNRLRFDLRDNATMEDCIVDWNKGARGAHVVLRDGGRVAMNVWVFDKAEAEVIKSAFISAGFKDVNQIGEATAAIFTARK